MKVYIASRPDNDYDKPFLYYVFEKSKAKHEKLFQFVIHRGTGIYSLNNSSSPYYWFEGLKGTDWYRGGFYIEPLFMPTDDIRSCHQGFCDGLNIYLLREIRKEEPKRIPEYDFPYHQIRSFRLTREDKIKILNNLSVYNKLQRPLNSLCTLLFEVIREYVIHEKLKYENFLKYSIKYQYVQDRFPKAFKIIEKEGDKLAEKKLIDYWLYYEDLFPNEPRADKLKKANLMRKTVLKKIIQLKETL